MNDFRLFKRKGRDAYYFEFTSKDKRYLRCTGCTDAAAAQQEAKKIYENIIHRVIRGEDDTPDPTLMRQPNVGSIDELIKAYAAAPSDASDKTRKTNGNSLCQIVSAKGTIRDLTPEAAKAHFQKAADASRAEEDQARAASIRRTANAVWRKAASLFTPKCLEYYKSKKLFDKCMVDFITAGKAARFSGRSIPRVDYRPPREEVIAATLKAWAALADTNRDMYVAIGHELSFGLRVSEVAQVRWSWHCTRNGAYALDDAANVKGGEGSLQVRALDPYYSQMMATVKAKKWNEDEDAFIIPGTDTYRTNSIFRNSTEWLRTLGWETMKSNHALRAYSGGLVAMRYGIYAAQTFLRHKSVTVTETAYAHFIKKFQPANVADIPAQWALVPTVAPTITKGNNGGHENKVTSQKLPDVTLDVTAGVNQSPLLYTTVTPSFSVSHF